MNYIDYLSKCKKFFYKADEYKKSYKCIKNSKWAILNLNIS